MECTTPRGGLKPHRGVKPPEGSGRRACRRPEAPGRRHDCPAPAGIPVARAGRARASAIAGAIALSAALLLSAPVVTAAGGPDHSAYDEFLKDHVRDGLVDYGAAAKHISSLKVYIDMLSDSSAAHYGAWDRDTRLAFWINAYNAITIYAVLSNYPIEPPSVETKPPLPENSIKHIAGVWDTAYVHLAGKPASLAAIERRLLADEFGDPRVHFALVRATMGDPLLSGEAYLPARLDEQLERAAAGFVNDGDKVRVNITRGRLYVSEIFEWHASDFAAPAEEMPEWLAAYKKNSRGFVSFIARRVDWQTREAMEKRPLKITYLEYDWSLNEAPEEP